MTIWYSIIYIYNDDYYNEVYFILISNIDLEGVLIINL